MVERSHTLLQIRWQRQLAGADESVRVAVHPNVVQTQVLQCHWLAELVDDVIADETQPDACSQSRFVVGTVHREQTQGVKWKKLSDRILSDETF